MAQKKDRERVAAEITLSHLLRMANEHGCPVSREQALAFLNQQGRAYEMWKQMMQAGEDFIARSLWGANVQPPSDALAAAYRWPHTGSPPLPDFAAAFRILLAINGQRLQVRAVGHQRFQRQFGCRRELASETVHQAAEATL